MLSTLRRRLILSHILPLLIVLPLMGAGLVYAVETQLLAPALSRELEGNAQLLAIIASEQPQIWEDPRQAQAILKDPRAGVAARVMLFDDRGRPLASTDTGDTVASNELPDTPWLKRTLGGESIIRHYQDPNLAEDVIDVMVPIVSADGRVMGVVRMTDRHATVFEEVFQLRYVIAAVVLFGLGLGAVLGYILAINISMPIQRVTQTISDLAHGQRQDPLPEEGPQEIRRQAAAVNVLLDRLLGLEKVRRRLLANLVHELGRPLGALRSSLSALMRGATQDPEVLDDILDGMDEEMARLQFLLEELTHLHGQLLGSLELDRQPIVLHVWLPRVLRPWQELAREKGQQWEAIIPANLPTIVADPVRLAQAVGNLTSNAI